MARSFDIAETGAPELTALMLATVRALRDIGGSASIQELDERIVELENVTEAEQQVTMANDHRPKLNYFLAWARTYLKRGKALENSQRGVWALTELGETITDISQCASIYEQVQAEERERQRQKQQDKKVNTRAKKDQQRQQQLKLIDADSNESREEDWKSELLDIVKSMEPSAFERLSQRLLREAGFLKVEVLGKVGDGGIDGIGILSVNLVSFQIYFQCKRYKGSVPSSDIRDFRGALQGRGDKGLFITTGSFTSQAMDEATRAGAIAIDLIDGSRLCDLLKRYELGVRSEVVESIKIEPKYFASV